MPYLTLGQAAKETGKSKATILNAIKKGRFTAEKDESGKWRIDPARLFQIYEPVNSNGLKNGQTEQFQTPSNTNQNTGLEVEIKLLREQLNREREINEDLQSDRDHWRQQAEKVSLLLTHKEDKPAPGLQGLFGLLKGKTTKT